MIFLKTKAWKSLVLKVSRKYLICQNASWCRCYVCVNWFRYVLLVLLSTRLWEKCSSASLRSWECMYFCEQGLLRQGDAALCCCVLANITKTTKYNVMVCISKFVDLFTIISNQLWLFVGSFHLNKFRIGMTWFLSLSYSSTR